MNRRGATLVEMMIVTMLTAMVIGSLTGLFGFVTSRAAHAAAQAGAQEQADAVAESIAQTVSAATGCTVVTLSGSQALRCTMPAVSVDRDGDGRPDRWQLWQVSRRGRERFGTGGRVWFYQSDATGAFGSAGTWPWRAHRSDDANPVLLGADGVAVDADQGWAKHSGLSTSKYYLVTGLTFSVDSAQKSVTYTVTASAINRDDRSMSAGDAASDGYAVARTRTVSWRNWRK